MLRAAGDTIAAALSARLPGGVCPVGSWDERMGRTHWHTGASRCECEDGAPCALPWNPLRP